MEDIKPRRSHSASLTPTEGSKFKFPPDVCSSVDRLRDVSHMFHPVNYPRRSFTPSRNAFYMNSPDISPINPTFEFSFKRMPPEKIRKVKADTTVPSTDDSTVEDFMLMPPPPRRKPAGSANHNSNIEVNARQRRMEPNYPAYGSNGRKMLRKVQKKLQQQPQQQQHVSSQNDILNIAVSLNSLLIDTGLDRYMGIFEREEIDLEVFLIMNDSDLVRIGIEDAKDRAAILKFKDIFHMNDS